MSTTSNTNKGRFTKGASGNPSGRPLGSRNQATLLMERLLEGEAEELIRKAIDLAKAGDTRALGLCLDRLMPPRKDPSVLFDFPLIRCSKDISVAMMSILAAVGEGSITPNEGETVARILSGHANALLTQELERRVEKLEEGPSRDDQKVEVVTNYR